MDKFRNRCTRQIQNKNIWGNPNIHATSHKQSPRDINDGSEKRHNGPAF